MSYQSIDTLQKALGESIFAHTKDAKKAAGRALGTIIELITYYLLRSWGFNNAIAIERSLPEYGNNDITHNVEFSLHHILKQTSLDSAICRPITATKLSRKLMLEPSFQTKRNTLLDNKSILKNACIIAENDNSFVVAENYTDTSIDISWLDKRPYAMVECKRVGVEEGQKKGPQTIEKAKQGAYVAQKTSSLQKVWNSKGECYGIIFIDNTPIIDNYQNIQSRIINGNLFNITDFTLSIGIVSNHGNWFTSENKNKELKVLSNSYDWLLFLSDNGLSQFIQDLILNPQPEYISVKRAFEDSYKSDKKQNMFTKSKIRLDAHRALIRYFNDNEQTILSWFNVINPDNAHISVLKEQLETLSNRI